MKVVISAFNEARMLPMCLGHLPKEAEVVLFDGAYNHFPHKKPYSTDGTLEIASLWGAEVVNVRRAWKDQCEKRTATLIPGEIVFVVDADEMLHTPLPILPDDADIGWVTMTSPVYLDPFLSPRVFRVPESGWHYAGRHHWIYDADEDLVVSHSVVGTKYRHAILPVLLDNARDMREPTRNEEKSRYLSKRNPEELTFTDESSVYPDTA